MIKETIAVNAIDDPHGLAYSSHDEAEDTYKAVDQVFDEYRQLIRDMDAQTLCLSLTIRGKHHDVGYEQLTMQRDLTGDLIPTSEGPFKVVASGICIQPSKPYEAVKLYDKLFDATMLRVASETDGGNQQYLFNEETYTDIRIVESKKIIR